MLQDMTSARTGRRRLSGWLLRGWRPQWRQLPDLLWSWAIGALILGLTIRWSPGISVSRWWPVPLAVLGVAIAALLLRPVLTALAVLLSWFGVFLIGLLGQAVVMYAGLALTPGIQITDFGDAVVAAWIFALVAAIVDWIGAADEEQRFVAHCVRWATRRPATVADPQVTGVVFVQLDGLPAPILDWGLRSGSLPTLRRWVRSGGYRATRWRARVPTTTPVSQAGLLHGSTENLPAFRWYERRTGRLMVANRPADAAEIEKRLSDGKGLLADDGASISNLFSGDAAVRLLSMSGLSEGTGGLGPTSSYASFFADSFGFARALVLTVGEMIKEVFQARRQRRRGIEPRVHRGGSYIALRAITNVMLRDLNVALVIEQMMLGRKAIFVDFVDYDEIAHHAGPTRPESIRSLDGLDQVLAGLERVAGRAPRPYRFVVLSDHGQSQGATFLQRYGRRLEDVVRDLIDKIRQAEETGRAGLTGQADRIDQGDRGDRGDRPHAEVAPATDAIEEWGPVNTFLSHLTREDGVGAKVVRRAFRGHIEENTVALGPAGREITASGGHGTAMPGEEPPAPGQEHRPELVVCGSGNLGLVYFARHRRRLSMERMEELYPGLVRTLADHPGVSFVVVGSERSGAMAISDAGVHLLDEGRVEGRDPLAPFGAVAAEMRRCAHFPDAPDIYVNSVFDPETDEVAAFEELVGCHGGLGGWQNQAVLLHPADWPYDGATALRPAGDGTGGGRQADQEIVGAETVHRLLVGWLEHLGHRQAVGVAPGPGPGRETGPEPGRGPV